MEFLLLSSNIRQGYLRLKFQSLVAAKHTFSYGLNTTMYNVEPGNRLPYGDSSGIEPRRLVTERALETAFFSTIPISRQIVFRLISD